MSGGSGGGRTSQDSPRFGLGKSEMSTRLTKRTPDEEEERVINEVLREANMLEANMTMADKRQIYTVLQESKENHAEQETQRHSGSQPQETSESSLPHSFSRLSTSGGEEEESRGHGMFEDAEDDQGVDDRKALFQTKQSEKTVILGEAVQRHSEPSPTPLSRALTEKGRGRGRATPIKYNYPPLALSHPEKKSTPVANSASDSVGSPQSPINQHSWPKTHSPNVASPKQSIPKDPSSPQSQDISSQNSEIIKTDVSSPKEDLTPEENLDIEVKTTLEDSQDEKVDIMSGGEDEENHLMVSGRGKQQPESPASVEDVEDEEEERKEPPKTVKVGKTSCEISPFEAFLGPMPCSTLINFQELNFLKDRVEWMKHAKETVEKKRRAILDQILLDNPIWGPPILEGGYNKQTLFKKPVPKFSKLFADSPERTVGPTGRFERQSKTQAMNKIQDVMASESNTPEYHSLRRSKHKESKAEDQLESRQHGNPWTARKRPDTFIDDDDDECMEYPNTAGDIWPSKRIEQRKNTGGSDPEVSPESPSAGAAHDEYQFEDDFKPAVTRGKKKNNRRGGKSAQGDTEVDTKVQRPRGSGTRGRSTRLRVQKGDISHPSEHATTSANNWRNKTVSSEHFDGETSVKNNINCETRGWLSADRIEKSTDISAGKFYPSPKVSHPRNTLPPQHYNTSRANKKPDDFSELAGSSRNLHGMHDDGGNQATALETSECPICFKPFPLEEIEAHCNTCCDIAEGENPPIEMQSSEGSNKTVVEVVDELISEDEAESLISEDECRGIRCKDCARNFAISALESHLRECKGITSSSTGHKRASSVEADDEPAKKTSRFKP